MEHIYEMGYSVKSGRSVKKWVTFVKRGRCEKCVTLTKMGHTVENGSHCDQVTKWATFRKIGPSE